MENISATHKVQSIIHRYIYIWMLQLDISTSFLFLTSVCTEHSFILKLIYFRLMIIQLLNMYEGGYRTYEAIHIL